MQTGRLLSDLRQRIVAFLNEWHVMSLATVDRNGPHVVSLFYACDQLALVWVSAVDTRHSRAIAAHPHVSATVARECSDISQIKGVQIQGAARQVNDPDDRNAHLTTLQARYPFLAQHANLPPTVREAYARARVYRLEPSRIVLIDNASGFGHKEVLELEM